MRKQTGSFEPFLETGRPAVHGRRGAVTSPNYLATQAGEQIIRNGGHAVEGAIAANAVLCVVYPHMAGLGGDLFALVKDAKEDEVKALNGSGRASENATIDFFKNKNYESIPQEGPLSANTVPGAVAGWEELHKAYGKLEWNVLFEDAIYYAEEGFPVTEKFADFIAAKKEKIEKDKRSSAVFLPGGQPVSAQHILKQPELAETFRKIAEQGASVFYEGEVGRKMIASLQEAGGFLTEADLNMHTTEWEAPISTIYRKDYEVFELKPNTQGVATLMMLNILDRYSVKQIGDNTPDYYHLMAEAAKITFAYRDEWVSDPAKENIPLESLLSEEHTQKMLDNLKTEEAYSTSKLSNLPPLKTNRDTTYMAVTDAEGNAVSLIQSIYHEFGSGFMAEGGFMLQNRGSSFSLDTNDINKLQPGKKTFHTIIPAMVMKNGELFLLMGTMGGEGQPQTQCAMLTRMIDFGYDVQQAIEAPRWLYGRTWGEESSTLKFEKRVPDVVVREISKLGHEVELTDAYSQTMGHAQAIRIEGDLFEAGADPRGDGIALSW